MTTNESNNSQKQEAAQSNKNQASSLPQTIKESSEQIKKSLREQEVLHLNIGYIVGLFSNSKYHVKINLGQFMASVIPALKHNQFKIFFKGFRPIAFVSWAMLSKEVSEKFKTGKHYLTIDEWKSGDQIWLGEFVTPYSDEDRKAVVKNLQEKVFAGKEVNIITRNADGSVKEIIKNFQ